MVPAMRKLFVTVVLAMLVAACGGADDPASPAVVSTQSETTAGTAPTSTTASPADNSGEPAAETTAPSESSTTSGPSFDGPPAPDFELLLADGSTFRLSDEAKPVYMIFWAEW